VSILDYEKLGRDSDMKDPRLGEHARPHLYQAQNVKPLADRVIIEPSAAEETTSGGIIIPDTAKEKPKKRKSSCCWKR
jgi:hypothetical protein